MQKKGKIRNWLQPVLTILISEDRREQVLQACKGEGTVAISRGNNDCIRLGGAGVACTRCATTYIS